MFGASERMRELSADLAIHCDTLNYAGNTVLEP